MAVDQSVAEICEYTGEKSSMETNKLLEQIGEGMMCSTEPDPASCAI